jgi:RNA polymerase sigma factor (TIGR02999 family)
MIAAETWRMANERRAHDLTGLLIKWREGDKAALDALMPHVYEELRRAARAKLRDERGGHTLQTTALVHEVYMRLVDIDRLTFESRAHFFAMAARMMRQILVDHARRKDADKRGGGATMVSLAEAVPVVSSNAIDVLVLDSALDDLAALEERLCHVVELRFFAGLTVEETAAALDVSRATIERDWVVAKAWLHDRLS